MQIKGLSHRLFHATFCSNQQFQAAGIPQPLWAPGPAFGCSPGKIFFILTGLNFQCCKFCLLPIILPLLTRLWFPSSLQLPFSSRGHQASPQARSFQLNKHFSLVLSPACCVPAPAILVPVCQNLLRFSVPSLFWGAQKWAQSSSSGLTRAAHRETPASHLLAGYSC